MLAAATEMVEVEKRAEQVTNPAQSRFIFFYSIIMTPNILYILFYSTIGTE